MRSRISWSGMRKCGVMPHVEEDFFGCGGGGWVRRWGRERRACGLSLIVFGAGGELEEREEEGGWGREDMKGGGHTEGREEDRTQKAWREKRPG